MGSRVRAVDQVKRDAAVVADRARGLRWNQIAERHKLSARQCQKIWSTRESLNPEVLRPDAEAEVQAELDYVDAVVADLAELALTTNNDAVRLGAIRSRLVALQHRLELRRIYGLLPWDRYRLDGEKDLEWIFTEIRDLFVSHGLPLRELRQIDEAFERRPLPSVRLERQQQMKVREAAAALPVSKAL